MSELPADTDDIPASVAQVVPKEHPHLEWMRKEITDEINRQISNGSDSNMSEAPISKDWIELKTSDLDHKIEMEKIKSDAKFERLFSESNLKFERMMAELKNESEKNSLKIDARFAQSEATLTKWLVGILFSLIGLGFAVWKSSQIQPAINQPSQQSISTQPQPQQKIP